MLGRIAGRMLSFCALAAPFISAAPAQDWPTYRHDNARSGRSPSAVDFSRVEEMWVLRTAVPKTAWAGAAKWDAFSQITDLKSMRDYDPVYHCAIADGRVYFGSSADHGLHCHDLKTGRESWVFLTDGPVRIAPTYADGRVCFGSDDGNAYCLSATDGKLLWKFSPLECPKKVIHDGNFISLWPCRTGVLVQDGTAYFANSLFPWQPSYLTALALDTGLSEGAGHFVRQQKAMTLEGYMLASASQLICPQGRVPPLLFKKSDGASLGSLRGGGGCFVLVTDDGRVYHGPGNKKGEIYGSDINSRASIANYPGAKAMVVSATAAYLLTETELSAVSRQQNKVLWKIPCDLTLELIMAGDVLIAGGRDAVAAFNSADGREIWRAPVSGRAYGLAVAAGGLVVSTDEGVLHAFFPGVKKNAGASPTPNAAEKDPQAAAAPAKSPGKLEEQPPFEPELGPYLVFTGPTTARVRWRTKEPQASWLEFGAAGVFRPLRQNEPKIQHELELTGLRQGTLYHYRLLATSTADKAGSGEPQKSPPYECDMFFNEHAGDPTIAAAEISLTKPQADSRSLHSAAAQRILEAFPCRRGICLDLGCGDASLALALAEASQLKIVCVDTDAATVEAARRRLRDLNLYGSRVVVHHVQSLAELPFVERSVDLIVSQRSLSQQRVLGECSDIVRPGGMVVLGRPQAGGDGSDGLESFFSERLPGVFSKAERISAAGDVWYRWQRPESASGIWTHQYGTASNSAFGGESLRGASSAEELRVQWFGRPGPRAQADRNGRKPSPLAAGGRLFVQGLHRITALSAFNGVILWTLEIPQFERFNIPRDCSNWCADENSVYTAVRGHCWKINAADGAVEAFIPIVPGPKASWKYEWGYIARTENALLGTAVKAGSGHTSFWGGGGWYDEKQGPAAWKVCSDKLFALDPLDGSPQWTYERGLIINSTISAAGKRVYFVESRHPKAIEQDSRRLGSPEFWLDQHLVALDVQTGRVEWERPIDTADGHAMFHLAAAADTLVLVSSEQRYHAYAFSTETGKSLWDQHFDWPSDNHGGHMARPAIVGKEVFVRPYVLDLDSGKILTKTMPGGGCGSYAATAHSLIFRAGNVTMWDIKEGIATSWPRLRPDCWISTIPACGMLLSPEGGGGCSCGSWMETSIGFLPDDYPPPRIAAPASKFVDATEVSLVARGSASARLRYTLDGSEPDENSQPYTQPIRLQSTTEVKVRAYWKSGKTRQPQQSSTASSTLTREYPGPNFSPAPIPFLKTLRVTLSKPGATGILRYTLDGGDPSTKSIEYEKPLELTASTVVKGRIFYEDGTNSPIVPAAYTLVEAEPLPAEADTGLKPGLECDAYQGVWQKLPKFSDLKPDKISVVSQITLATRTANDGFALRFRGYLRVPAEGVYTFYLRSDDGSRLLIGQREVVNNDGIHAAVEKSGWIALGKGMHPIEIEYWDAAWGEFLQVGFEGPGMERRPLAADALFHRPVSDEAEKSK